MFMAQTIEIVALAAGLTLLTSPLYAEDPLGGSTVARTIDDGAVWEC